MALNLTDGIRTIQFARVADLTDPATLSLVLGATRAMEKNMSWGRRLSAPLGAVLLALGLVFGAAKLWP